MDYQQKFGLTRAQQFEEGFGLDKLQSSLDMLEYVQHQAIVFTITWR
jgi:hypothetical protein